jgi:hypothetical protein
VGSDDEYLNLHLLVLLIYLRLHFLDTQIVLRVMV